MEGQESTPFNKEKGQILTVKGSNDDIPLLFNETGKETGEKEIPSPQKPKPKTVSGISFEFLPEEISEEAASEFVEHRKNLKKKLTQNSFDRAMKIVMDASRELGFSADEIIHEVIDAGWQGVKVEWLRKRMGSVKPQQKSYGAGLL